MSKELAMVDMTVEAIYSRLCKDCKKLIDSLRESLRKDKVKWFIDHLWDGEEPKTS